MTKLRYTGPIDEVELPGVGSVKRGSTVDVPTGLAGRPPDPRLAEAMIELQTARIGGDHEWQRDLRAEIAGLDAGDGLLAQSTWELVKSTTKQEEKS